MIRSNAHLFHVCGNLSGWHETVSSSSCAQPISSEQVLLQMLQVHIPAVGCPPAGFTAAAAHGAATLGKLAPRLWRFRRRHRHQRQRQRRRQRQRSSVSRGRGGAAAACRRGATAGAAGHVYHGIPWLLQVRHIRRCLVRCSARDPPANDQPAPAPARHTRLSSAPCGLRLANLLPSV